MDIICIDKNVHIYYLYGISNHGNPHKCVGYLQLIHLYGSNSPGDVLQVLKAFREAAGEEAGDLTLCLCTCIKSKAINFEKHN